MASDEKTTNGKHPRTRIFAGMALSALIGVIGYAGHEGYRVATDSFVAPIILGPDNDAVLSSKLKVAELYVERARTSAQIESIDQDAAATATALSQLRSLRASMADGLTFTSTMTKYQASANAAELRVLGEQKEALRGLLAQQEVHTHEAQANMSAGLISKTDFEKEQQAEGSLKVALIETSRTEVQLRTQLGQLAFAQKSLGRGGPAMPEQLTRDEQIVRVDLEIMRLESDGRTKAAEKKVLQDKLSMIQELDAQLRTRPIFRAVERSMDVAFVPYTQIEGMQQGATVVDCVWGIFHCKPVGTVAELVPGEVILPDPWGTQARGQYAVLDLSNRESAKSKTLRVRPSGAPQPNGVAVSSR